MTNANLLSRRANAVARGVAQAAPIFAERAEGAELWDVEGRRFLDFAGGIAVLNTGHCHPWVIAAAERQMKRFTHAAAQVVGYEAYIELAERLNAKAPIDGAAKTVLFTTGAEAVENAVKIARSATGRRGVLAFTGGFHGRTMMTMALTGKVQPYKRGFGPLPGEVYHLPFPSERDGVSVADTLAAAERLFKATLPADEFAAVIIEPVQGEGGFRPVPPELMAALAEWRHRHGMVLIADEVQSGFGRTGRLFALEHYDVTADLVTTAKSLAGGFPLSGVIGRAELMDAVPPGGLGGTYGGNPVACAAALAVLELFEDGEVFRAAAEQADRIRRRLEAYAKDDRLTAIRDIRGLGAMLAFDVGPDRIGTEPAPQIASAVVAAARERGLIVLACGAYGDTIRLLPPLTIDVSLLEEGLDLLGAALADAKGAAGRD